MQTGQYLETEEEEADGLALEAHQHPSSQVTTNNNQTKGRLVMPKLKGEEHTAAKLTAQAVREIRECYDPGRVGQQTLAEVHGVS